MTVSISVSSKVLPPVVIEKCSCEWNKAVTIFDVVIALLKWCNDIESILCLTQSIYRRYLLNFGNQYLMLFCVKKVTQNSNCPNPWWWIGQTFISKKYFILVKIKLNCESTMVYILYTKGLRMELSVNISTYEYERFETDLTQHSTALKQWRTSLWSVHSCRHDRNTFSASPYQPASDKKPPTIER